jgi:hypothetical protein
MYLIVIDGKEDEGAYAAVDEDGKSILYVFEEEDDADRFAMLLEQDDEYYPQMSVLKVGEEIIIRACEIHGYDYQIFTSDDIVIPPFKENTDFI